MHLLYLYCAKTISCQANMNDNQEQSFCDQDGDVRDSKILVVDDESLVRWCLHSSLSPQIKEVALAQSGFEALELIKNHTFDLVITDLHMDGLDGFALVRKARQLRPELRFILITGALPKKACSEIDELGILAVVEKPFNLQDIQDLIHRYLRG